MCENVYSFQQKLTLKEKVTLWNTGILKKSLKYKNTISTITKKQWLVAVPCLQNAKSGNVQ